jgi:type IV fimbrial biogenesis protein FimT
MNNRSLQGFTLSELLVSLAVLGLIAAFAIPKVLTAVGQSSARAIGSELIAMISESYESVKAQSNGVVARSTSADVLTDRMNYVTKTGSSTTPILTLQNGATITYNVADTFANGTTGVVGFNIDPDGSVANNGPVSVYLGGDGRVWLAHTAYRSGTGTSPSIFSGTTGLGAQYGVAADTNNIAATAIAPGNTAGADTTWAPN